MVINMYFARYIPIGGALIWVVTAGTIDKTSRGQDLQYPYFRHHWAMVFLSRLCGMISFPSAIQNDVFHTIEIRS